MELFLTQSALKEYLRFRRLFPWILLAGFSFLVGLAWYQMSRVPDPQSIYSQVTLTIVFKLVALASAIFSTAAIGQEIEQKTIVYLVTRPVPRWKLILTRFLASALVVAMIGIVCALMVSLAVYRGGAFGNPLFWRDAQAIFVGAFAYGGLFLFVSLLFNKSMLICLLFAFGWETMVPNMPGDASYLSVFSYVNAIAAHPSEGQSKNLMTFLSGQLGDGMMAPGTAWIVMIIMILGFAAASAAWFTHFEYVPREDTE